MQTLGDIVQIGLIILGVYAFGRVFWRAWVRPLFQSDRQVTPPRWSIRDELARLFLVQDEETVNHSGGATPVMSRETAQTAQTVQTDKQTDHVSEADVWLDRLEVDRTKTALIELLVYSGWEVGQIRGVLKGDNGVLGTEIEAAKIRLGMTDPPRQLRVRDETGERLIPMEG